MRRLAFAALLIAPLAHASPAEIAKAVTTNVVELGKLTDDDKLNLADGAIVVATRGQLVDLSQHDGCVSGAVANAHYGCNLASITHAPGKVTSDVVGDVGWFVAPFTITAQSQDPDTGKDTKYKDAARAGGIAVRDGKRWKIAAIMYTTAVSDKQLLETSDGEPVTTAPKATGDAKLAQEVGSWFATGFAAKAAAKGTLLASGTAPNELKTGTGAVAMAKTWDALKLGAKTCDAKVLAGGKIGWVRCEVMMPRKKAKGAVAIQLAVVVVPDGSGGWRWVSMQYQAGFRLG
jgi:hypothetical protein